MSHDASEAWAGESIYDYSKRMTEKATETNQMFLGSFNEIRLAAYPGDAPGKVVDYYYGEMNARSKIMNKPVGKQQWSIELPAMTLRDYFAGQAVQSVSCGVIAEAHHGTTAQTLAVTAYEIADAMLAARERTNL